MPRGRREPSAAAVERPTRVTRNSGGFNAVSNEIRAPRGKRVADENIASDAKTRKRAAFGDLTNVSLLRMHFNFHNSLTLLCFTGGFRAAK